MLPTGLQARNKGCRVKTRTQKSLYGSIMLDWLYEIFVTIVTFVMSLFGFDLNNRSVALEPSDAPKEPVKPAELAEPVKPAEPAEPVEAVAETATELP